MKQRTEEGLQAAYIATLAEGVAVALFVGMLIVWSAIGSGA